MIFCTSPCEKNKCTKWNIKLEFNVFFSTCSSALGPVRDLSCDYNSLIYEKLNCSWLPPADLHGDQCNYSIKVRLDGKLIHLDSTASTSYKIRPGFAAVRGRNYEVSVMAKTSVEGVPSSTTINFINSGKFMLN